MDEKLRQENRELAKTVSFGDQGLVIQNLAQATLVADTLIASGLVPTSFKSASKIIVVAQAAKELGKPLWWGLNNMYVVHNKVGISAAAVSGLILGSGQCVLWDVDSDGAFPSDDYKVIIVSKRKGFDKSCQTEFSVADAKMAGLWTSETWKKYPKVMLTWRAIAFHARLYYSDVLGGQYTDDELNEIGPPLAAPECDTPPRHERRKKIASAPVEEVDPLPAKNARYDQAECRDARATPVDSPPPQEPVEPAKGEAETDVAGSVGEAEEHVGELYGALKAEYDEKGGDDFNAWAADALCVGDDEVENPEDFTVEMIESLTRYLVEKGV